jgi:hypothetical protein
MSASYSDVHICILTKATINLRTATGLWRVVFNHCAAYIQSVTQLTKHTTGWLFIKVDQPTADDSTAAPLGYEAHDSQLGAHVYIMMHTD